MFVGVEFERKISAVIFLWVKTEWGSFGDEACHPKVFYLKAGYSRV